jgi:hypothetical protein
VRFYHYTAAANVETIRELGIVAHPLAFGELGIEGVPAVWLTTDDDWPRAVRAFEDVPPLRDARIVVDLSIAEQHAWRWHDLGPKLCAMAGGSLDELLAFNRRPGAADWWVYLRSIPKERLGDVEHRP